MKAKDIVKFVEEEASLIAKEIGLEIVDVEYIKEGVQYYLRIYADKENGIDLDSCAELSRRIEKLLDKKDPVKDAYILEVSSPGINRVIKKDSDFEKYKDELVDIKLYQKINKQKEFTGKLKGLIENKVVIIDSDDNEYEFERKDIASIRLAVFF